MNINIFYCNMWWIKLNVIFSFIYGKVALGATPPPTYGLVFTESTTTPASTTITSKPTQSGCHCVAADLCPSILEADIRIVNHGDVTGCPNGQVWCCESSNLVESCGIRKITNSLPQPVGTARYGAYPWQVALLLLNDTYFGSGVLINSNHVMTAAHKVAPHQNKLNFKLRLGDWDGQATHEPYSYQEFKPVNVVLHPKYNSNNLYNDIAIIKLNSNVPLATSPHINTACLPTGASMVNARCYVAGWGKNAFGKEKNYQRILKEVDVPIVDQMTCQSRLRTTRLGAFFNLNQMSFMCAGGEFGKDSCTGDGGAPLVCPSNTNQWHVVGLVAWGIGCADSTIPGVYVNIYNYLSWIREQTAL